MGTEPKTDSAQARSFAAEAKPGAVRRPVTNPTYVWIGVLMGVVWWIAESAVHVLLFKEGDFFSQLFTLDPHELWKRLLVVVLLIVFSLYAQHGINVRRRTEEALAASEKKYRTLIEEALNPVFVMDEEHKFVEHNDAALEFFECDAETLRSRTYDQLLPAGESVLGGDRRPLGFGQVEVDVPVDGRRKTLLLNVVPLSIEGAPPRHFGIGQDITERKRAESDLALAHAELHQIFHTASAAMRLIDADSNVLKVNQTFVNLSGVSEADAIGAKCHDVFAGDHCGTDECPLHQVLGGAQEIEYEITKTRNDGTEVSCLLTARPFVGPDGRPVGIVESFKDITELARVQEELRTERDRLRHILFQQFEGVGIVRQDFMIEYQNATLRQEVGDCIGRTCFAALRGRTSPCPHCFMNDAIDSGRLEHCEFDVVGGRLHEHTYTPFRDANGEEKVLVLIRDITERKASRASVIRSEQLAALGELAAGVAHEINNPINGIINYAQMLINKDRSRSHVKEIAGKVVAEGDRVAKIVESLLAFARRESQIRTPTSVSEILTDSLTLVGAQLRKDAIKVDVELPVNLPKVLCVPQEIQQVFLNILSNARYALNERYPDSHDSKRLRIAAQLESNGNPRCVRISFVDNGTGIPRDMVDKVLNPFFSTKPKGKGTGLGLTICHEIMREHGGRLTIESVEAAHTTVNLDLPELVM
jgi:PAS domain S-box-containing protein